MGIRTLLREKYDDHERSVERISGLKKFTNPGLNEAKYFKISEPMKYNDKYKNFSQIVDEVQLMENGDVIAFVTKVDATGKPRENLPQQLTKYACANIEGQILKKLEGREPDEDLNISVNSIWKVKGVKNPVSGEGYGDVMFNYTLIALDGTIVKRMESKKESGNIIRKLYIDVDNDFTGILLLEVDKQDKCYKEIFFKQCDNTNVSDLRDAIYNNVINPDYNNMIIGFNSRSYDLGERLKSLLDSARISTDNIDSITSTIAKRDRDLMDICLKRGISIKGENKDLGVPWMTGLFTTVDNMIGYFDGNADRELEKKYRKALDRFRVSFWEAPTLWNADIKKEYICKNMHKWKNEADVRALPLLEDALKLLYSERVEEDNYING